MKVDKEVKPIRRNCIYPASISERAYGHPSIKDYSMRRNSRIFTISAVCYRWGWFNAFKEYECNSISINNVLAPGMDAIMGDLWDFRKLSIRDRDDKKK